MGKRSPSPSSENFDLKKIREDKPIEIAEEEVQKNGCGTMQAWLNSSKVAEILSADAEHRVIFLLLTGEDGEKGVLLAEKTPFSENLDNLHQFLVGSSLTEVMKNDIFGSYILQSDQAKFNEIKTQLIYPANDKIIAKYRSEEKFIIRETAEDYLKITIPYIEKFQLNLTWVYNFLEKKKEAERIICEDSDAKNGFLLAPDIKWDGVTLENLYCLAIINRRGVRSIRDLTGSDLVMLENVRDKSLACIESKYGVKKSQINCYFHYQPSFFHLHVHFVSLKYNAPASSAISSVLLDDVISNLKIDSDFYKKATLTFARKASDKLLELFQEAGAGSL